MKVKIYILFLLVLWAVNTGVKAQQSAKSVTGNDVPIDTVADEVTSPVIMADGGDNVSGKWFIEDGDPTGWEINQGVYDSELDSYVDELIGHRKEDDANNSNSFRLWNPEDSAVVWNVSSPMVKFKVKITDGQDWTFGNEGNLGIYFWITIWDDYKMEYRTRKVRYNKGPAGVLDGGEHWSDYTPHGLGEDIDDGKWHEVTLNLKADIQESRDMACNNGVSDACKYWKFYSITALEVRALHIYFDDITVIPDTSSTTGLEDRKAGMDINIYPNPSCGKVFVDLGRENGPASVELFSISGRKVASYENVRSGTMLDLNRYERGTYFITVRCKTKVFRKKICLIKE